jgi:hypothetical protein
LSRIETPLAVKTSIHSAGRPPEPDSVSGRESAATEVPPGRPRGGALRRSGALLGKFPRGIRQSPGLRPSGAGTLAFRCGANCPKRPGSELESYLPASGRVADGWGDRSTPAPPPAHPRPCRSICGTSAERDRCAPEPPPPGFGAEERGLLGWVEVRGGRDGPPFRRTVRRINTGCRVGRHVPVSTPGPSLGITDRIIARARRSTACAAQPSSPLRFRPG